MMLKIIFVLLFAFSWVTSRGSFRIYLIRHAEVDLRKPGWGTSKSSAEYKSTYNVSGVKAFDSNDVLQKIKNHENLDTVFCSPQLRALETAMMLFNENVVLLTDSVLAEIDYPVVKVPVLQLPIKGWLFVSRIMWMAGINRGEKAGYGVRLDELSIFVNELIKFAYRNETAVVVAHGMLNRKLLKILKNHGWKYCEKGKDGLGNLSVNCLEYF